VIVAREHGFCRGVKNALSLLDKALEEHGDKPVYSIGEIIHNTKVVDRYRGLGVKTVDSIKEIGSGLGVVRAHGLPASVIAEARAQGFSIIDATCPYVRLISRILKKEAGKGSKIYLLGEPGHPEVIASTADFASDVTIIDHASFDPERFEWPKSDAVLLSQTTMAEESFLQLSAEFIKRCRKVTVYNTICNSTRLRQSSAVKTAAQVQAMVVIGGKKSSNTKRLAELCGTKVRTIQVESAEELETIDLSGLDSIGVTAGASTPEESVQEIVDYLKKLSAGSGSPGKK
ncbi:MAG TPA: 4-hydroxy-3-methylbut-2-enyl diphosphate reductase, partial [Rectinemataceae bacterium]